MLWLSGRAYSSTPGAVSVHGLLSCGAVAAAAYCPVLGSGSVAVATSAGLLRLYSLAGRQLAIISLAGTPVALAIAGERCWGLWLSRAEGRAARWRL